MSTGTWLVLRTPLEFSAYRNWAPDTFPLLQAVVTRDPAAALLCCC